MKSTSKAAKILPTLALILSLIPALLTAALVAASTGGNWAFLILAFIAAPIVQLLCGGAALALGILSVRKGWGRVQGIIALILSSLGLLISIAVVGGFLLNGLLI